MHHEPHPFPAIAWQWLGLPHHVDTTPYSTPVSSVSNAVLRCNFLTQVHPTHFERAIIMRVLRWLLGAWVEQLAVTWAPLNRLDLGLRCWPDLFRSLGCKPRWDFSQRRCLYRLAGDSILFGSWTNHSSVKLQGL